MWFVWVCVVAFVIWLLWGKRSGQGVGKGGRIQKGRSVAASSRVPRSKLPIVEQDMFAPLNVPFDEADAVEALGKFFNHIGWRDDLPDTKEEFQLAMEEHSENLKSTHENLAEVLSKVDEELSELVAELEDAADLDADERSEFAMSKRKLVAAKKKLGAKIAKTQAALSEFTADRRPFLVAYLNHEIHGRKSPVATFEFEDY